MPAPGFCPSRSARRFRRGSPKSIASNKKLDKAGSLVDTLIEKIEKLKAQMRAKVEHPFQVIKRQFEFVKVRYCSLSKNTAQLVPLFALSNLWMMRGKLMKAVAGVRQKTGKTLCKW